jgi:hypothetical protein
VDHASRRRKKETKERVLHGRRKMEKLVDRGRGMEEGTFQES